MCVRSIGLVLVLCLVSTVSVARAPDLEYALTPQATETGLELRVDLWFRGDPSGVTTLILPSHWAGQDALFRGIRDLRGGRGIRNTDEEHLRQVDHRPGARVHVRYRLVQDTPLDFSDPHRTHRPILTPAYFHVIGHGLFVHPALDEAVPRRIRLRWRKLPDHWALADSFGAGKRRQELVASIEEIKHAIYVGGDFRLRRLELPGGEVVVALRGDWPFEDADLFDLVRGVVRVEREFWDDLDFPYYLITMIPTGTTCCSFGGTTLTDSFAMFIATDRGIDLQLQHLLAHELLHTWIGQRMRNVDTDEEPEPSLYWFSEGFTDHYTRDLLLRAELIDEDTFLEDLNGRLYAYHTSPVRNAPNARIVEDYWNDRHVQQLPYQRGDLLAALWDAAIREVSKEERSLDDVMRELLRRADREGARTSRESLRTVLSAYLERDAGPELERYVDEGVTIPAVPLDLGEDVALVTLPMAPFVLGFDFDASREAGVVTGLDPGGPAAAAGLREGQQLAGFSIHWDDAGQPVVILVEEDGEERRVEYLPAGPTIPVPQYARPHRSR
jgi:predicted metalloprotease with PDZ domain